jgi:hypothetical protein
LDNRARKIMMDAMFAFDYFALHIINICSAKTTTINKFHSDLLV